MNKMKQVLYAAFPLLLIPLPGLAAQTAEGSRQPAAAPEQTEVRDPHAYSGGYTLTSGPYALPEEQRLKLADEQTFAGLWMDRLEFMKVDGEDSIGLEGFVWLGDSYNRFILKTETEITDDSVEEAEIDLLRSHAVSPFWNLQFGVRREVVDDADRHWAALGINGLAPYWFEVDANVFIGDDGRTAFEFEAKYELLLTQHLILQPRIDLTAFGKSDRALRHGDGLSEVKTGARLRYEFSRRLAPYLGVEQVARFGHSADLLPAGVDRTDTRWVIGLKFWF